METTTQELNWRAIIISVVIILALSTVINVVATMAYGFYVGFQTRGDSAVIATQLASFIRSIPYVLLIASLNGLLIFWRGRVLLHTLPYRQSYHVILVAGLSLLLGFLMGSFFSNLALTDLVMQTFVQVAVAAVAVYVSTALPKKTTLA